MMVGTKPKQLNIQNYIPMASFALMSKPLIGLLRRIIALQERPLNVPSKKTYGARTLKKYSIYSKEESQSIKSPYPGLCPKR